MQHQLFTYSIDVDDLILSVDEAWLSFAQENGATELTRENVVNQPIWKFIDGAEINHLYEILLAKVRSTRTAVKFPFRCDSPHCRRFMEMDVSSTDGQTVQFHSRLLKEELREPIQLLATAGDDGEEFLNICAWCKRVKLSEAEWCEIEEAIERLDLMGDPPPQFTHGMCPNCFEDYARRFGRT